MKKGKKNRGQKGRKGGSPAKTTPVSQLKVVSLEEMLQRIYAKEDLSTTCLRQCTCCRVACPQMKFCEATSIIDHVWATRDKDVRKRILVTAVKYFFSDSLVKPCMLLEGKECLVYDRRPLNCRLYGLWPSGSWEDRVAMFVKSTGLPRERLPLNVQCQNVRRKPQTCKACNGAPKLYDLSKPVGEPPVSECEECGGKGKVTPPPLTGEQIAKLFEMLDQADSIVGVSDLKISTSWNYRTFHDWVLLKFWGEHVLAQWTHVLLTTTPEQRQGTIEAFEQQVDKLAV